MCNQTILFCCMQPIVANSSFNCSPTLVWLPNLTFVTPFSQPRARVFLFYEGGSLVLSFSPKVRELKGTRSINIYHILINYLAGPVFLALLPVAWFTGENLHQTRLPFSRIQSVQHAFDQTSTDCGEASSCMQTLGRCLEYCSA